MTQPTFQLDAEHRQPIGEAIRDWLGQCDDSDGRPLLKLLDYTDSRNIDHLIDKAIVPTLGAIVAAGRPTLEGFRRALLAPREIVRAADGSLNHPALPVCDENARIDLLLAAFGIQSRLVAMESDVDAEPYEAYHESGDGNFSSWTPTLPEGKGWMLISMWETEDGPHALYAREAVTESRRSRRARAAQEDISRMKEGRWCPDHCPLTGRRFFMWLDHPELGYVPTYGGPFDSYTIAEPDADGYYRSERYDHDAGSWIEGGEPANLRDELLAAVEVEDDKPASVEPAPPAPVAADGEDTDQWVAETQSEFVSAMILAICELPDRSSPESEPGAMVANSDEIAHCVDVALEKTGLSISRRAEVSPATSDEQCKCRRLGDFDGYRHHPLCPDATAPAKHCAHDYVRSDRVCTECGEKTDTADKRAVFEAWWVRDVPQEYRENTLRMLKQSREQDGKYRIGKAEGAWEVWQAALASRAGVPGDESEDAYVIRRLSETLADVSVTLRGDDPVQPGDPINKIELVKRLAEVLRLEVELYRAQAAALAEKREAAVEIKATFVRGGYGVLMSAWEYDRSKVKIEPGIYVLRTATADGEDAVPRLDEATFQRLFIKHGGPVDGEGWCINESGLRDFLADLAAPLPRIEQANAGENA